MEQGFEWGLSWSFTYGVLWSDQPQPDLNKNILSSELTFKARSHGVLSSEIGTKLGRLTNQLIFFQSSNDHKDDFFFRQVTSLSQKIA